MTPGNLEFVEVIASFGILLGGSAAIVVRDERTLTAAQAARAWTPASRDAALLAIYNFTLLAALVVPLHFWRTRRTFVGLALGVGWLGALYIVDATVVLTIDFALGGPGL